MGFRMAAKRRVSKPSQGRGGLGEEGRREDLEPLSQSSGIYCMIHVTAFFNLLICIYPHISVLRRAPRKIIVSLLDANSPRASLSVSTWHS